MIQYPPTLEIVRTEPEEERLSPISRLSSLTDLWAVYFRLRGDLAPNTMKTYRMVGRKFCGFMEGRKLEPLALIEWMLFLRNYKKPNGDPFSAVFINRINIHVRGFLHWLKIMGYIHKDLDEVIPNLPAPALKESQILTNDEFEIIKKYCTGRDWCQVHLWLITLSYRTGMSLVDACYLRWRDVHLNNNGPSFIDIHRIKTRRLGGKALCQIPVIPFTDVHEWLLRLKQAEHLNYKRFDGITDFVHQDAPGLYECTFSRVGRDIKNIFLRAGITPGRSFKHLRNSFCSMLVNSNTNLALVCKMTGHNNVRMLLRYLRADRRALQDGLARAFSYAADQSGTGNTHTGLDYAEKENSQAVIG